MDEMLLVEKIMPTESKLQSMAKEEVIMEGMEPQKYYYLDGLFLEGETRNHNGRIYPRSIIKQAVDDLQERIRKGGPIPGECEHPEGMEMSLDRLAVATTEVRMDGNNCYGKMRVVPAGLGLIVEGAIKAGIRVGVSSRGRGQVGPDGRVSNYTIKCIDVVLEPSAPNAYPEAYLAESIRRYREGLETMKLVEAARYDAGAQKHLARQLEKLFVELRDDVAWNK